MLADVEGPAEKTARAIVTLAFSLGGDPHFPRRWEALHPPRGSVFEITVDHRRELEFAQGGFLIALTLSERLKLVEQQVLRLSARAR